MELPDVGHQCDDPTCKQLDFLPFVCKCKKTFCADHYLTHTQKCPLNSEQKVANLEKFSTSWKCSHPSCNERSLVPLICTKCHQHYCLQHRHVVECVPIDPQAKQTAIDKVQAPIQQFSEAKAKVDEELNINIESIVQSKKDKKREMAMKVQLMRMKNKATGLKTIPQGDRVYFLISKPRKYGQLQQAVFVSKCWSIGRAIDAIANECQVTNRNNVSTAEKLCLFKHDSESEEEEQLDFSLILNDLINDHRIIDGQQLSLEYVS